jgi:hypothetical protein
MFDFSGAVTVVPGAGMLAVLLDIKTPALRVSPFQGASAWVPWLMRKMNPGAASTRWNPPGSNLDCEPDAESTSSAWYSPHTAIDKHSFRPARGCQIIPESALLRCQAPVLVHVAAVEYH